MEYQLRIYTIRPGAMTAWITEWRLAISPLRRSFGFEVLGAWVIEEEEKFVWILGYDGEGGWAAADAAYYGSKERRAIEPDPARHLAHTQHWMMQPA